MQSYREATRYLDRKNLPYYTFTPPDEKTLRVVLRGVPEHYTEDEIKTDLETKGHQPEKVVRFKNKDKRPIPLVLVILPRDDKQIYKLRYVKQFAITVESQKPKSSIGQCHRCQLFGHAQSRCTAPPKCVKCAGNHITAECIKPPNRPPKCANCGGEHPASYRGCSKYPKRTTEPYNTIRNEISYSAAVKNATPNTDASNAILVLQNLLSQFSKIAKQFQPNNQ